MQVILSVNCPDFECVKERIEQAKNIAPGVWLHLDVSDGKFTFCKSWNNPKELQKLSRHGGIDFEVHLMVENPGEFVAEWLEAGAKRVIAHLEAVQKRGFRVKGLGVRGCEMGLAVNPGTSVQELEPYLKDIKFVEILAVRPGPAGQKFDEKVLGKIRFLKKKYPDVKIEVDGGINLKTAKMAKEAGADIVVSASYVFNSPEPRKAFEELENI